MLDPVQFLVINLFLLCTVINSVYTGGGRSGEHVHIKLHVPQVYKKHTHIQTIVKHHFHPPPPPPKPKAKVHHYHHHHHSHKSKSKSNSHFHYEHAPILTATSHYEMPSYKPKKLALYSPEYHFGSGGGGGGGYNKPMKYISDEGFRPSMPLFADDGNHHHHMPEYVYHSDETHEDIMEEPENEYDETKSTPYYSSPTLLAANQPLHTSFRSSSLASAVPSHDHDHVGDDDDDDDSAAQWDGLLSNKKYKLPSDIELESPHDGITWPQSIPSELETYSTIPKYTKPTSKKLPKFIYDLDSYDLGYTNSELSALANGGAASGKINKKWPSPSYSTTRLFPNQHYED